MNRRRRRRAYVMGQRPSQAIDMICLTQSSKQSCEVCLWLLCRWGNWGTGRLRHLPKVICTAWGARLCLESLLPQACALTHGRVLLPGRLTGDTEHGESLVSSRWLVRAAALFAFLLGMPLVLKGSRRLGTGPWTWGTGLGVAFLPRRLIIGPCWSPGERVLHDSQLLASLCLRILGCFRHFRHRGDADVIWARGTRHRRAVVAPLM